MEEKTGSTTMRFGYDSLGNAVSILYNGTEPKNALTSLMTRPGTTEEESWD